MTAIPIPATEIAELTELLDKLADSLNSFVVHYGKSMSSVDYQRRCQLIDAAQEQVKKLRNEYTESQPQPQPRILTHIHNFRGEVVEVPEDLEVIIAVHAGVVVWSRDARTHQVRYGLQITTFKSQDTLEAAHAYGECIGHVGTCQGLLEQTEQENA